MRYFALFLVAVVALLHVGFMVLEMFFWDHPIGRRIFSMTAEQSASSATLAANQGLYNGLFAGLLLWAAFTNKRDVILAILGCIIVAGIFGAATAKLTILYTQALPALIALGFVLISKRA